MSVTKKLLDKKQGRVTSKKKGLPGIPDLEHNEDSPRWTLADAELMQALADAVTLCGGAVMFTSSADKGVLGIGIYHDDYERKTHWLRDKDELDEKLKLWANHFFEEAGVSERIE